MLKKISFALFDSGETILGALIFSTLFPLYITEHIDSKIYSFFYGISFIVSFAFALILGKIADERRLRKKFYVIFTSLTFLMGVFLWFLYQNPYMSLFFFSLMAIFHQQSLVFYNSLLLDFESRGFVSGLGVAFGYIGSAISLIFLAKYLNLPDAYIYVSLIFLALSLPSFFSLENPKETGEVSIKKIFKDKKFLLLILSILSLTEVANTLIAMMSIYLKNVYGFGNIMIYKIIGLSAIGGIVGGIFWGKITDRLSPQIVFPFGFLLWIAFVSVLPITPREYILMVGFIAGLSLAHLWTTSRVLIIEEFPKGEVSVRLSFLSLTERIASTTGLLTWTVFMFITGDNYRLSAFLMIIFPIVGIVLYVYHKKL